MTNLELDINRLKQAVGDLQKQVQDLTAREQARLISEGKIPNQHIGKKTREVLIQEIYSLINTKPAFRKPDHTDQIVSRWHELAELVGGMEADSAVLKLYRYFAEKEEQIYNAIKGSKPQ